MEQLRAGSDLSTPQRVERIARRYIDSQSYHLASRVFIVDVAGGQPVTNESRILERELERKGQEHAPGEEKRPARRVPDRLLGAPAGLATVSIEEAGKLRMVTRPIDYEGRRVARCTSPIR